MRIDMTVGLLDDPKAAAARERVPGFDLQARPARERVRHVRGPGLRPVGLAAPAGRPSGVPAPQLRTRAWVVEEPPVAVTPIEQAAGAVVVATRGLELTRRGIALVLGMFLLMCTTAVVVLVTGFLAVPNTPPADSVTPVLAGPPAG